MAFHARELNEPISFRKIIARMGFNKYLGFVLITSCAWSLQPWFLSGQVLELKTHSESLFLVARYVLAISIFLLLAVFVTTRKGPSNGSVGDFAKGIFENKLIGTVIAMGVFMFLSRFLELKAYGDSNNHAFFGMIFSILIVVFWDFKKWIFYYIFKKKSGSVGKYIITNLSEKLESPIDLISWAIQSILVLLTALLFIYGNEGYLPDLNGDLATSFLYALESSFFLSLFYDFISPIEEYASRKSKSSFDDVFFIQLFAGIMLLATAIIWWLVEAGVSSSGISISFNVVIQIIYNWSMYSLLLFTVGYVLIVTVVGYFVEHISLNLYDDRHAYGNWKIKGREWASITATFDPFLSVALVIPTLTYFGVQLGDQPPKELYWVILSSFGIAGVALPLFMRVWSQKLEALRTKSFVTISTDLSSNNNFTDRFKWLSRIILFKKAPLPELSIESKEFLNIFSKDGEKALLHIIRFHSQNSFGFNASKLYLFTIHGGGYLFDQDNQEGLLLWDMFKENLGNQSIKIFSIREVAAMCKSLGVSFTDEMGDKLQSFCSELEEMLESETKDKLFNYIACSAFTLPDSLNDFAKSKSFHLSYIFECKLIHDPLEDRFNAIERIMDTRLAERAIRKTLNISTENRPLQPKESKDIDFSNFDYNDSHFSIKGSYIIPYQREQHGFIESISNLPNEAVIVIDESVLISLIDSSNSELLSRFADATRNMLIIMRSDKGFSLFIQKTTQGSESTTPSSIP